MEIVIFWTCVVGLVCCCSVGYDSVIDGVRRRFQLSRRKEKLASAPDTKTGGLATRNLAFAGKDIMRGYDTPELFYQDTLVRIQLGGSIASPADMH